MSKKYISAKQYWAIKYSGRPVSVKYCNSQGWMLTIPADMIAFESLDKLLTNIASDDSNFTAKFSVEIGKNSYKHYQALLYWKNMKSGLDVEKIFPNVHIEPCKDITASIKYVGKDKTHVAGPYAYGSVDQVDGMYTDADVVKRNIYDAAKDMIVNHDYCFTDFILDDSWKEWALTHVKAIQNIRKAFVE